MVAGLETQDKALLMVFRAHWRPLGSTLLALAALTSPGWAQNTPKPTFEDKVLPILKDRCFKCHAGAEPKNGLKLSSRREILAGGKSGPAIRINAAESSLLWIKIAGDAMPQGGPPLTAEEKGILRTWIN